jgi:hypothetical protein
MCENLSGGSAKNRPLEKIDYFVSTSNVDFLKANFPQLFPLDKHVNRKVL